MHTQRARLAASLLGMAGLLASAGASAALIHDEALHGDFSDLASAPTALGTLALGSNTVNGRLANNFENNTEDGIDVFSFVVGAGTQVSAIGLNFNRSLYPDGATIALFAGLGSGASSSMLGRLNTIGSGIADGDDLFASAAFGFGGPLAAGAYTVDLNGVGPRNGIRSFSFNFSVDPVAPHNVPEPASALLVAASLLALGATRARRSRRT